MGSLRGTNHIVHIFRLKHLEIWISSLSCFWIHSVLILFKIFPMIPRFFDISNLFLSFMGTPFPIKKRDPPPETNNMHPAQVLRKPHEKAGFPKQAVSGWAKDESWKILSLNLI